MDTISRLKEAIQTGEVFKIRYAGGSQPDAVRSIAPINIEGSKLRARCYTSNAVKTFIIEKIDILKDQSIRDNWDEASSPVNKYDSLEQLLHEEKEYLLSLGWHTSSYFEAEEKGIMLHRRFKNVKALKKYELSITYDRYNYQDVIDFDNHKSETELEVSVIRTGERKLPYSVNAKDEYTKNYKHIDKASNLFLEKAKQYAPNN
jgi:hypothetical protein